MTNKIKLMFGVVALIISSGVISKELKLTAPLEIEADQQSARLNENVGIFKTNVRISHGNMKISADYLEAHKRDKLGEDKQLLIATGSPVTFTAKQEDGTVIEAKANKVTYDVATSMFTMEGSASFTQGGNVISADAIIYDRAKQIVSSQKNKNSKNQVKTVITTGGENKP